MGTWRAYFEHVATFARVLVQSVAQEVELAEVWGAWYEQNMTAGRRTEPSGRDPDPSLAGDDHFRTVVVANALARTVHAASQRCADLEGALAEVVDSCHGLDPLHAETRVRLDDIRARIDALVAVIQESKPDFTIPDPTPTGIDHIHTLLHSDRAPT